MALFRSFNICGDINYVKISGFFFVIGRILIWPSQLTWHYTTKSSQSPSQPDVLFTPLSPLSFYPTSISSIKICLNTCIFTYPKPRGSLGHHRWLYNQFSLYFSVLHCPLGLGELQACPFPDIVFRPLFLSSLSFTPFTVPWNMVLAKIQQAIEQHKDLLTIVKRRKLKWYGHVSRSSGLAKTILPEYRHIQRVNRNYSVLLCMVCRAIAACNFMSCICLLFNYNLIFF